MKKAGRILLWLLCVFMAVSAILFFPSAASILMALFAVIAAPIPKLQSFLSERGLHSWRKISLLVVLFLVSACLVPSGSSDDLGRSSSSEAAAGLSTLEASPSETVLLSASPSPAPTPTPSPSPAPTPTSSPSPAPTPTSSPSSTPTSTVSPVLSPTPPPTLSPSQTPAPDQAAAPAAQPPSVTPHLTPTPTPTQTPAPTPTPVFEPDPEPIEEMVWIPTNGGKKYHRKSTCSQMIDPEQVTAADAISRGFTPCKRCYG